MPGRLRRVAHLWITEGNPLTFSDEENRRDSSDSQHIATASIPNLVMGARQSGKVDQSGYRPARFRYSVYLSRVDEMP